MKSLWIVFGVIIVFLAIYIWAVIGITFEMTCQLAFKSSVYGQGNGIIRVNKHWDRNYGRLVYKVSFQDKPAGEDHRFIELTIDPLPFALSYGHEDLDILYYGSITFHQDRTYTVRTDWKERGHGSVKTYNSEGKLLSSGAIPKIIPNLNYIWRER